MKINGKTALASVLFIGAIFILGINLLTPVTITISIVGSDTTIKPDIWIFTLRDVIIIAASALVLGISAMYLLFFDSVTANPGNGRINSNNLNRSDMDSVIKTLKDDEKIIYNLILEAEGVIYQSDIVMKSEFPKAKVSRCLDALENSGIVERKRKGMGNIVLLK